MFCANEQLPLINSLDQMPKWKRKLMENKWAKDFHDLIFPYINERNFAVIYSKNASRPNSPANVLVGLLIIKEVMRLNDEELIGSLIFDARFQYALHTMERATQPVSINTLTNFRNRLTDYLEKSGIDLIKIEVEAMAERITKHLNIDPKLMRMDSLMISSSCKKVSRIELVYSVNRCMVKALAKLAPDVGNVLNAYDGQNQVILHYDLEQNIYSDQKFSADTIDFLSSKAPLDHGVAGTEKKIINVDGAYYTEELSQKATLENIDLVPGQLTGAKPDPEKLSYAQFQINEETNQVKECPGKQAPDEAYFDTKGKCYTVKMSKVKCAACPLRDQCPMKPQQKMNVIKFSEKRYHNDQLRALMGTQDIAN